MTINSRKNHHPKKCPWSDSNARTQLRRLALYPSELQGREKGIRCHNYNTPTSITITSTPLHMLSLKGKRSLLKSRFPSGQLPSNQLLYLRDEESYR